MLMAAEDPKGDGNVWQQSHSETKKSQQQSHTTKRKNYNISHIRRDIKILRGSATDAHDQRTSHNFYNSTLL